MGFWKRKRTTGSTAKRAQSTVPARVSMTRQVRIFTGKFECGCDMPKGHLEAEVALGHQAFDHVKCPEHNLGMAYQNGPIVAQEGVLSHA